MATGGNLVVPMVLWGDNCPTHCISTVLMTTDQRAIVTGCNDGQLAIWDVAENWEVNIIMMLEIKTGHHSPINTKMNIKSKVPTMNLYANCTFFLS
jgi:hypothetical protein